MGANRTHGQWWDWHGDQVTVDVAEVRAFGHAAYEAAGASPDDAAWLFDALFDKTLQGDHARGLVYLPGMIKGALAGEPDLAPAIRIVRERGATAVIDGGEGKPARPNDLVCRSAMRLAIDKAKEHGVGVVGAQSGSRLLTPLVQMAIDAGMIGIVMTQSIPTVAPVGGFQALLGNGPTAIGIPAGDRDPVIFDLSFTETSSSPVLLAARQGEQIPPGLILDADGQPTTDARDYFDGDLTDTVGHIAVKGSLAPIGGGHKGYALLFVIGLLVQVLSETDPPWDLAAGVDGGRFGSLHLALDPTAFNPGDVGSQVDRFIGTVTSAPVAPGKGEVLYPGQRSQELRRAQVAVGTVEVPRPQAEALCELGPLLGIEVPASLAAHGVA
ncbi:MAG: hypothetical protein JWO68_3288 [Actinomycetia bacterium]|nr:hypothetical protein [Actinomycetes bacterium]